MQEEIAPLVEMYREVSGDNKSIVNTMGRNSMRRLLELSTKLCDYYVNHKMWKTADDYFNSILDVDPFGMFNHRESIRARVLGIRQPLVFRRI